jgi:hypothetical protein
MRQNYLNNKVTELSIDKKYYFFFESSFLSLLNETGVIPKKEAITV